MDSTEKKYDFYNRFSKQLLMWYAKSGRKENVAISPVSVLVALCLAAELSEGETRQQILTGVFDNQDMDTVKSTVLSLLRKFSNDSVFQTANAVYLREKPSSEWNSAISATLKAYGSSRMFTQSDVPDGLNQWIQKQTEGMIRNCADNRMKDMPFSLMNAMCFNARWKKIYKDQEVYPETFRNADNYYHRVPMMHGEESYGFSTRDYIGFAKPYLGWKYVFMTVLPRKKTLDLNEAVTAGVDFYKLNKSMILADVQAIFPEFIYDCEEKLEDILSENGLKKLFSAEAEFPFLGHGNNIEPDMVHKVHIEVDRTGTKAAALTSYKMGGGLPRKLKQLFIKLDRPFYYAVLHEETGLPILIGIVNRIEPETGNLPDHVPEKQREKRIAQPSNELPKVMPVHGLSVARAMRNKKRGTEDRQKQNKVRVRTQYRRKK